MPLTLFHLAIPVAEIEAARKFYAELLGCAEGRSAETWVDFNLFGHQLVCHLDPAMDSRPKISNQVDGQEVPIPHFGVILEIDTWKNLAEKLEKQGVKFVIEPYIRFAGQTGEQATLFLLDPSGNALEFKAFRDIENQLFEK